MPDTHVMNLPDGRELAWLESGSAEGRPVFMFHGTPGTRLQVSFNEPAIVASGIRFVAPDRPGNGHSSYHRGRTLADWAGDVGRLADHLGIERFAVAGVSGGGPHALACARFLADRVTGVGVVSGIGPVVESEYREAMEGFNRASTHLAARAPVLVHPVFSVLFPLQELYLRRWPEAALRGASKTLPESDLMVLRRPEVFAAFLTDLRQASARAAAQDFTLFVRPWGFRLEDIEVPAHIWHGDADKNVPYAHGELTAERISGAQFHSCPGEGHLLVVPHLEEILRTVSQAT